MKLNFFFSQPRSKPSKKETQLNNHRVDYMKALPDDAWGEIVSYLSFSEQLQTDSVNQRLQAINALNIIFLSTKISKIDTRLDILKAKIDRKEKRLNHKATPDSASLGVLVIHPMGGCSISGSSDTEVSAISRFFIHRSVARKKTKVDACEAAKNTASAKKEKLLLDDQDVTEKMTKINL